MIAIISSWVFHLAMILLSITAIGALENELEFASGLALPLPTVYLLKMKYLILVLPVITLIPGVLLLRNRNKKSIESFNSGKIDYSVFLITLSLTVLIFSVFAAILPFLKIGLKL